MSEPFSRPWLDEMAQRWADAIDADLFRMTTPYWALTTTPLLPEARRWFGPYRLRDFWGSAEDETWEGRAEGYMGA